MPDDARDLLERTYGPGSQSTEDVLANMPAPSLWERAKAYAAPAMGMWHNSEDALARANDQFNQRAAGDLQRIGVTSDPDTVGMLTTLIGGVRSPSSPVRIPNPIKAYHVSPHDYDVPSLEHVGSGQGAQSYGHGLYAAESAGARDQYFEDFKAQSNDLYGRDPIRYDWNIHATPEQFLDWDRPVPSNVNARVRQIYKDAAKDTGFATKLLPGSLTGEEVLHHLDNAFQWGRRNAESSATDALRDIGIPGIRYLDQKSREGFSTARIDGKPVAANDMIGSNAIGALKDAGGSPRDAIAQLETAAKNTRYPDEREQWTRAAQLIKDGRIVFDEKAATSNYVVWSPEIIEILKKYGIAGPVAASILHQAYGDKSEGTPP